MDDREEHGDHVHHAVVDDQPVQAAMLLLPDDDHRQAVEDEGDGQDGKAGEKVHIVSWLVYFHCLLQHQDEGAA